VKTAVRIISENSSPKEIKEKDPVRAGLKVDGYNY
jgi:hypothetical protein